MDKSEVRKRVYQLQAKADVYSQGWILLGSVKKYLFRRYKVGSNS